MRAGHFSSSIEWVGVRFDEGFRAHSIVDGKYGITRVIGDKL